MSKMKQKEPLKLSFDCLTEAEESYAIAMGAAIVNTVGASLVNENDKMVVAKLVGLVGLGFANGMAFERTAPSELLAEINSPANQEMANTLFHEKTEKFVELMRTRGVPMPDKAYCE